MLALAGTLVGVARAISLLGITPDLQGSRYVYLASAWWSIALASALNPRSQPPYLRLAAVGCLVLVIAAAMFATRMHLGPWERARADRDRVLSVLVSLPATCRQAAATGVTDNVAGAYVFRNGLNQALHTLGRSFEWVAPERAAAECRVDISPP